jgi:hypothetical protein
MVKMQISGHLVPSSVSAGTAWDVTGDPGVQGLMAHNCSLWPLPRRPELLLTQSIVLWHWKVKQRYKAHTVCSICYTASVCTRNRRVKCG